MKKSVLTFSVIVIVISIVLVAFFGMADANSRAADLNNNVANIQKDYDDLQTKYYALLGNFSELEYNYQSVLLQSPSMAPNPGGSGAPNTEQMLTRYQALQQMYSNLQSEFNHYKEDYQKLKSLTDLRLMQGDLRVLITPNDPAVMNLVRNITGRINATDPNYYWKDIKAMYDWVNMNIKYRDDGLYPQLPNVPGDVTTDGLQQTTQMAQFPNETLTLKMGDCEDYAALLVSMIRAYWGSRYLAECIWITGANAGHVAIVIPFREEQMVILDPIRDYFSHDTLGNIALNTISSEIYNWMQIWRPSLGNDVHVYRVFSDYMDKYFNGTEEYVNWMYNR
jgi:hypothetical protein